MSSGLYVQCSIYEGHVRGGLQESPVRALQGNQIPPTIVSFHLIGSMSITLIGSLLGYGAYQNDIYGPYDPVLGPPYLRDSFNNIGYPGTLNPLQETIELIDNAGSSCLLTLNWPYQNTTTIETYTYVSSLDNNTKQTSNSGNWNDLLYDSHWQNTVDAINGGSWCAWQMDVYAGLDFSGLNPIAASSSTNASKTSGSGSVTLALSGSIPWTSYYSKLNSDAFAQTLSFGTVGVLLTYTWTAGGSGPSLHVATGGDPGTNPGTPPNVHAASGWDLAIYPSQSIIYISRSMAKFTAPGGVTSAYFQQFFIAKIMYYSVGYVLTVVRTGIMYSTDVIADTSVGDLNLPFPTEVPFPISANGSGTNALTGVIYFAVIGQDPAGWAAANHYTFS